MSSLSLIRILIFWNQDSSLVTSLNFNCFHKSPISKYCYIDGLGLQHTDMKGHKHSAHIDFCFLKKMFISSCVMSSLLYRLYSRCNEQGFLSSDTVQASHPGGFSYLEAQTLNPLNHTWFSSRGAWAPKHRLNSCGAPA